MKIEKKCGTNTLLVIRWGQKASNFFSCWKFKNGYSSRADFVWRLSYYMIRWRKGYLKIAATGSLCDVPEQYSNLVLVSSIKLKSIEPNERRTFHSIGLWFINYEW